MQLFDTHAHLYLNDFCSDIDDVIERAQNRGVESVVLPNIDKNSIEPLISLCKRYPGMLYPAMGLHPSDVKDNYKEQLGLIKQELDQNQCVAVGEIGVDLYWDKGFISQQKEAFKEQLNWATEKSLPVVLHVRDAFDDAFEVLEEFEKGELSGVFHCFSGSKYHARRIIEMGFHLGIGGVLTFKGSKLCATVKDVPLENIVLETDAPFLTPSPHRGKRNESAYVYDIAKKLSEERGVTIEEIAEQTTINARKLFGL
ncbi:MAG: TatD family hydrolase [Bacteroidales bacterium]